MTFSNSSLRQQNGFNLIEAMFAVLIIAITMNYAVPAVGHFMEKNQLKQAAERIYQFYRFGRSEAIKRSDMVHVMFKADGSTNWSTALGSSSCDPEVTVTTNPGYCSIRVSGADVRRAIVNSSSRAFEKVSMNVFDSLGVAQPAIDLNIDPVRGTSNSGGIVLATPHGWKLQSRITPLGQIETCIPASAPAITGYQHCA